MSNENNKRNIRKGHMSFVLAEKLGVCPCCDKDVYNNQLYVNNDDNTYHYSCYNYKESDGLDDSD